MRELNRGVCGDCFLVHWGTPASALEEVHTRAGTDSHTVRLTSSMPAVEAGDSPVYYEVTTLNV